MDIEVEGEGSNNSNSNVDEPPRKKSKISHLVSDVNGVGDPTTSERGNLLISDLPHDVLINIFKYLDFKTISCCATLCKSFNRASNDSSLYHNIILKSTMGKGHLDAYTSKISYLKKLSVEYEWFGHRNWAPGYLEFNKHVAKLIKKCGQHLSFLKFESCRSEGILQLLTECPNLKSVSFYRCKASFEQLPTLKNLTRILFLCSDVPNTTINKTIKNNPGLKAISLSDNINLNESSIAETIGEYNRNIEEIYLCKKTKIRAKGMRAIARCNKLLVLELKGEPFACDPEDSLQQMAAGCPLLERLAIYGWKGINDDNFLPVLQCCKKLKVLDLRGISITIKSCQEAALSLPMLKTLDIHDCPFIKKAQLLKLQKDLKKVYIINTGCYSRCCNFLAGKVWGKCTPKVRFLL